MTRTSLRESIETHARNLQDHDRKLESLQKQISLIGEHIVDQRKRLEEQLRKKNSNEEQP